MWLEAVATVLGLPWREPCPEDRVLTMNVGKRTAPTPGQANPQAMLHTESCPLGHGCLQAGDELGPHRHQRKEGQRPQEVGLGARESAQVDWSECREQAGD